MFITYDLPQTSMGREEKVIRGAKEIEISGKILGWQVGEFETESGKKAPAVLVRYRNPPDGGLATQTIEIPGHAQNVQVHTGSIPQEYKSALKTAT